MSMDPRRVTPDEERAIRALHSAQAEARARELSNPTVDEVAQSLGVPAEQVSSYLDELRSRDTVHKLPRAASAVPWTLALCACIFLLAAGALMFRAIKTDRADARTAPEVVVAPQASASEWDTRVPPAPEAEPAPAISPDPDPAAPGHPVPIESDPPASNPPKPLEGPKIESTPDPVEDGSGYPQAQYERGTPAPEPRTGSDATSSDTVTPEIQSLP